MNNNVSNNNTTFSNKKCCNCGQIGHIYKNCREPKTSLGIISFKIIDNDLKFLMIQRRNTHGFVEFLKGKYNLYDLEFLKRIINEMSIQEKKSLLRDEFEDIWKQLWTKADITLYSNSQMNEYRISKSKFLNLKRGGYYDYYNPKKLINLEYLIKTSSTNWKGPEWGFPKGKRKIKENDMSCAIREYTEETGLDKKDIQLLNLEPKVEIINATNNIKYKHIYYFARIKTEKQLSIDSNNFDQVNEISNIGYYDYKTCLSLMRPYHKDRKIILYHIYEYLKKVDSKKQYLNTN